MFNNRYSMIALLIVVFAIISGCCRTVLLLTSLSNVTLGIIPVLKIYSIGLLYDFIAACYFVLPFSIYVLVIPNKLFNSKINRYFVYFLILLQLNLMVFSSFSEWFFWNEFGKRFNFIAVDYLVYTHEVIHNILESYPVKYLLLSVFIISCIMFYIINVESDIFKKAFSYNDSFMKRLKNGLIFLFLPLLFFYTFDGQTLTNISKNQFNKELSKNGIYSIFSAFRHNTLDYNEFYKTENINKVMNNLKKLLCLNDKLEKVIKKRGKEHYYNVEFIMVESLSAEYMGAFGDHRQWTPFIDNLTKHSLFFNNLYAVGTRTVRGMEGVVLSLPPTPGRSIVKRPNNYNLFSAGFIFNEKGYESKFIYAGFGYFDNMNDFFSHNGFKVIDRTDFKNSEITFSNAWGACDEDLFNKVLKESDKSFKKGKPFFNFIMTTSNHRPYTYPNGRIDIPSHTGRAGAVKYTDFAIKKFLINASKKPWYKNTVFVIVADHNAHSAGKTSLPVWRYKIPLIIYAPYIFKHKKISKLSSQIDIMPTLFSLFNWTYRSKFYGDDILSENFKERAFISNYQKLGFLRSFRLTVLSPDKQVHEFKIMKQTLHKADYKEIEPVEKDIFDAVTFYESAFYMYKKGFYTWKSND